MCDQGLHVPNRRVPLGDSMISQSIAPWCTGSLLGIPTSIHTVPLVHSHSFLATFLDAIGTQGVLHYPHAMTVTIIGAVGCWESVQTH